MRRQKKSVEEVYQDGKLSHDAKQLYDVIVAKGAVPLHALKSLTGFQQKESKSRFDRAVTELQMRMFITMCARQQKLSQSGEAYGWFSTVFCTMEQYFGPEVFEKAASLKPEEAVEAIRARVLLLNPSASGKAIEKFIRG